MAKPSGQPPRVLICYSHDSPTHMARVLELAQRLRAEGIDAWLDQFELAPPQGWPRWMVDELARADYVLLVCTPTFRRRFEGSSGDEGAGASFEGLLATQLLYEGRRDFSRVVPVLFAEAGAADVPTVVRPGTRHQLPQDYAKLVAQLRGSALVVPAPLGSPGPRSRGLPAKAEAGAGEPEPPSLAERGDHLEPELRDEHGLSRTLRLGEVRQRFRWIAPGSFEMGSAAGEAGARTRERPRHTVVLSHGFWLADTPCTAAAWEAVMGEAPDPKVDPRAPVTRVDHRQVRAFLARLARRVPGFDWRLPTEAQWEYACRAGSSGPSYARPREALADIAWTRETKKGGPSPVARLRPNDWGLYDMLGNVWEWCADGRRVYTAASVRDPRGEPGEGVAVRGGSWLMEPRHARAAYRTWWRPDDSRVDLGFRILLHTSEPAGVE